MSDPLRTRIAAALFNVEPVDDFHGGIIGYLEGDEPDLLDTARRIDGTVNFALLADAVIAELDLKLRCHGEIEGFLSEGADDE